jgi:FtsZ-binding cell division protein ZapB
MSKNKESNGKELEEENNRLISQVMDLEDQIKNLKEELNELKFEKNDWEEEKLEIKKLREKTFLQKQEREYLKTVQNTDHIALKRENHQLKRKLDKIMKMLKKKNDQSESQIWGAFSTIRGSVMPYQVSNIRNMPEIPQESFSKNRAQEDQILGNLNMTMVSNKDSNDSFLNRSGRSDIANNINGINKMIGENQSGDIDESMLVNQRQLQQKMGHRRVSSDPREFINGSVLLKNNMFKKDDKVSKFAALNQMNSGLNNSARNSFCN